VTDTPAPLPTDLAAAHAMILAERSARLAAEARAEEVTAARLEIERLKLEIARLRREKYGPSSERAARIEQLELSLEALEETAAEASAAAETQFASGEGRGDDGWAEAGSGCSALSLLDDGLPFPRQQLVDARGGMLR
jgi:hypothetical protein